MFNPKEEIKKLKIENRSFINGQFLETNYDYKKHSPIENIELPPLNICLEKEINLAVNKAKKAYKIWKDYTFEERKKIILKLANLIEENKKELALLDTIETGRSIKNMYFDSLPKAIEAMRWFAEAVDKYLDYALTPERHRIVQIVKNPIGVVGIITPWNDPLVVSFWKLTPALLMGNSVVLKPAEQSSFSILKVAKLAKEAGIPDGIFNVVLGDGKTGELIARHNDIRALYFTGSSEVGKKLLVYSGESNMKKVYLECGGKGAFILTPNYKDLNSAAKILAKNIFYNQGQICSSPSRLIIHKNIKEKFLDLLLKESQKYIPSNPLSLDSEVGYISSKEQFKRVEEYIKIGLEEAKVISYPKEKENAFTPTIFEVDKDSKLAKEEIFGPVLVVIEYEDIEEAIEIANNTKYGLASAVFSDDINEAFYVAREVEVGLMHINTYDSETNQVPFGGVKESGIGRDKSIFVFDEYSETKTIWTYIK